MLGGLILALVMSTAVLAPAIAPHDPGQVVLAARLRAPSWQGGMTAGFLLGADHLGRDVLSRVMYGSRVSLAVGIASVILAGSLGLGLGLISGYVGGMADRVLMRVADVQLAFPYLLLVVAVVAVLGPGLLNIVLVLGLTGWVRYARLIRGEVLALREREFVLAGRSLGASSAWIMRRHLLPNVLAPLIVLATLELGRIIILEASLSFLGLGVPPATPSWGGMLNDGRTYLVTAWWLATFPGLAIVLTVTGVNLMGDWLRDVLDPRRGTRTARPLEKGEAPRNAATAH